MQRNGKASHIPATTLHAGETARQESATTLQGSETSMHAGKTTLQGRETTLQGSETSMHAGETTLQGSETSMHAGKTTLQGRETPLPAREKILQASGTASRRARRIGASVTGYDRHATIDERLCDAKIAIEAALADANLRDALAAHGYDAARLQVGLALRDHARDATLRQQAAAAAQLAATDARDDARKRAHAVCMRYVAIARVALRDDLGAKWTLDLARRKRTQAAWIMQARQFYGGALADANMLAKLAAYGVTRSDLEEGQGMVAEVEAALVVQSHRFDMAYAAMRARDAAMRALDAWMRDFGAIARVAANGGIRSSLGG